MKSHIYDSLTIGCAVFVLMSTAPAWGQSSASSSKNVSGAHRSAKASGSNSRKQLPTSRDHAAAMVGASRIGSSSAFTHGAGTGHVRPATMVTPGWPSSSAVRHRGVNPAGIGGPVDSRTAKSGALDGTHMPRKR